MLRLFLAGALLCALATTAVAEVVGTKPAGCPSRWCGCWLAQHMGLSDRSLWLARKWASVGAPASGPAPGVIVVWRHHVGKIIEVDGRRIKVISGNDSRAVRVRWRATDGVISYRWVEQGGVAVGRQTTLATTRHVQVANLSQGGSIRNHNLQQRLDAGWRPEDKDFVR